MSKTWYNTPLKERGINMHIRELTVDEFNTFAKENELSTYHQTVEYALLKIEHEYEYEIIGYIGDDGKIKAAAIVLVKLLNGYLYAYIPEGMLIDFHDERLVQSFTNELIKYYKKESISFIKINPPVVVSEIDANGNTLNYYSENRQVIDILKRCGYTKLEDNLYFENLLPRFNALVDLDNFSINKLSKNTKNKIRKGIRKGLTFEKGDVSKLDELREFVKKKIAKADYYYSDYYNIFHRNRSVDFFLISIDYEKYTYNSQNAYEKELKNNEKLNNKLLRRTTNKIINQKMNSDKTLLSYKNDIAYASSYLNTDKKEYIAGALVIKHKDTASIIISGYDKKFKDFAPNYFLYYNIIEYYKNEFKYVNLNGISGDFGKEHRYVGLNKFKLGFNPTIQEYIGEFDLVINKSTYAKLSKKGLLNKEFNVNKPGK